MIIKICIDLKQMFNRCCMTCRICMNSSVRNVFEAYNIDNGDGLYKHI